MATRPLFRSQKLAVLTGFALWGAGIWCLKDAFDRRGRKAPFAVRMIYPPDPF